MHIFKVLYKQTCQNVDHIIENCNLTLTGYFFTDFIYIITTLFFKTLRRVQINNQKILL